jgi:hypothetical protein
MSLSMESRVVATTDHVFCELEGEGVVLNLADSVYYGLNETSLAIWTFIQKPVFVWDRCESDILNVLEQLKDSSLLTIASEEVLT